MSTLNVPGGQARTVGHGSADNRKKASAAEVCAEGGSGLPSLLVADPRTHSTRQDCLHPGLCPHRGLTMGESSPSSGRLRLLLCVTTSGRPPL